MSRQFIRLQGVRFNNPALPTISSTPTEQFIDRLPGLRFWLEPESRFEYKGAGKGLRDRKSLFGGGDAGGNGYTLNTAINGKPTVTFSVSPSSQGLIWANAQDFRFIESGYTVFAVLKTADMAAMASLFGANGGSFGLRVTTDLRLETRHAASGTGVATVTLPVWTNASAHIVMFAWDAQSGRVHFELDGAVVPVDPGRVSAVPAPSLAANASVGINRIDGVGTGVNSSFGTALVLDRPYSSDRYSPAKRQLYKQWSEKYGIPIAA